MSNEPWQEPNAPHALDFLGLTEPIDTLCGTEWYFPSHFELVTPSPRICRLGYLYFCDLTLGPWQIRARAQAVQVWP